MPLNGRQMTALITASGGSSPAPGGDFTGSKYSYQTISVSIAGGGGNTTLWRFDGGDNQDYMANGNLPYIFPDAVAQFSVESTDLGAQDGGHVGGLVNVVTQSGTNQFHGSGFEFIRNNYIDATNFFSVSKDTLHQNQFGGTFGGPIKRNKMFAFAAYQRWKADQSQSATSATVPTAANLTGDWSVTDGNPLTGVNLCNSTGKPIPLVDPLTGTALAGNKYPSKPTYSAPALALQAYLPAPNSTVDPNNCGFVRYAIPYLLTDNQFDTKVDYTISPKNNLYGPRCRRRPRLGRARRRLPALPAVRMHFSARSTAPRAPETGSFSLRLAGRLHRAARHRFRLHRSLRFSGCLLARTRLSAHRRAAPQ